MFHQLVRLVQMVQIVRLVQTVRMFGLVQMVQMVRLVQTVQMFGLVQMILLSFFRYTPELQSKTLNLFRILPRDHRISGKTFNSTASTVLWILYQNCQMVQ